MRTRPCQKRTKGHVFPDPLLQSIKVYNRLEEAATNGMELHTEVDSVMRAIFPLRDVPVADRPGYITHERDYFTIDHIDAGIKKDLEAYFTDRHSRYRNGLYDYDDSLGGLLEGIAWHLLVTGDDFHMIEWGEVDIKGNKYQLPIDFSYLRNETMKVIRENEKIDGYKQKYSSFTYLKEKRFKDYEDKEKPRSFDFEKEEILYCQYPFSKGSPTAQSIKYLAVIKKFWQFGLDQARSGAEVESYYLPLEKARYTTFAREKRAYDLARGKIRTIFNYIMEGNGPKMTQYYDVYTVIRYRKYLNNLRDYLVREFNEQVLAIVAIKNKLTTVPKLTYNGFVSNSELESALQEYTMGKMSFNEVVEIIKRP